MRTGLARRRSGSTPCASPVSSCGASMRTRRSPRPSTPGRATLNPAEASSATAGRVAPVPRDGDGGPVFEAPWQANAFAMTLALHQRGVFTWTEWASTLAAEIKRAQAAGDPDTGETYYSHWLNTLEKLVAEKGVTTQDTLHRYRDAWDRACDRTPHGEPIELREEDFS